MEKKSYTKEEVKELFKLFADHVYKGYYVHKWDLEDVLQTTERWLEEKL